MKSLNKQLKISNQFQKAARMMIDQQMWCWGCDVRQAEKNLLSLYGADKRPSPNPRFHSAYVFQLEEQAIVNLWGWGLWISCPSLGSLFIARSHFKVYYTSVVIPTPDAWRKRDLPLMNFTGGIDELAHAHNLLTKALHWIGTYETWINTQFTLDYRERVLTKWPQKRRYKGGVPAPEMAKEWFKLSTSLMN